MSGPSSAWASQSTPYIHLWSALSQHQPKEASSDGGLEADSGVQEPPGDPAVPTPRPQLPPHAGTCLMDPEIASQPCYTSPGWKELSFFLFCFVFLVKTGTQTRNIHFIRKKNALSIKHGKVKTYHLLERRCEKLACSSEATSKLCLCPIFFFLRKIKTLVMRFFLM